MLPSLLLSSSRLLWVITVCESQPPVERGGAMQSVVPFFEEFARGPRKLQAANYKDVGDQLRSSVLVPFRRSGLARPHRRVSETTNGTESLPRFFVLTWILIVRLLNVPCWHRTVDHSSGS